MRNRHYILLATLTLITTTISAQDKWNDFVDKVMQWPVIGVVYPTYSPETNWSFGGGIQACFNMPEEETPSHIKFTGCYTLNRQWQIYTTGTMYMAGKVPWLLYFGLRYRDYPDVYFDWVNDQCYGTNYSSQRGDITLQPLIRLPNNWAVGPMSDFILERTNLSSVDTLYHGSDRVLMWSLGMAAQYDSRDYTQYATKGMAFTISGLYYEPKLGADYRAWDIEADFRHYLTLWQPTTYKNEFERVNRSLIFSYQLHAEAVLSDQPIAAMPFQIKPTLGGDELLRGVRSNMYRDNVLWAVQTELRFPIYSILRGTVFAGVGDVYNTDAWRWTAPKVGYGLGLRVAINRAHVNVRFDIARNNYDKDWSDWDTYSLYLTASEAF